jgi:hypothetical protein
MYRNDFSGAKRLSRRSSALLEGSRVADGKLRSGKPRGTVYIQTTSTTRSRPLVLLGGDRDKDGGGARRADVVALVGAETARLVVTGAGIGIAGGLGLARLAASLLFQVSPADAGVYAAAALLVGSVAALAGLVPARRAATVDPMSALRQE